MFLGRTARRGRSPRPLMAVRPEGTNYNGRRVWGEPPQLVSTRTNTRPRVNYLTFVSAALVNNAPGHRRRAMDEQPSTHIPAWLTIDIMVIVMSAVIIGIGIWIGLDGPALP